MPGKAKVLPYMPGFFELDNRASGYENFVPEPYDVMTGETIIGLALSGTERPAPVLRMVGSVAT